MQNVTILGSSGTNSSVIDLRNGFLTGVSIPATKTGTGFALQVSEDGTTFLALYSGASTYGVAGVASTATVAAVDPDKAGGWPYARLVASSAQASAITLGAMVVDRRR